MGRRDAPVRCVGVINLTDRLGGDRFTLSDRKLVAAVANQIGAAVENARLVERDMLQQRLSQELELAHDLQLKLLPSPSVLAGDAQVAARCIPAESVGGDFYTFTRLGRGRVGVMLGDVSSHGFSAALVMALVMSAAGIHAAASLTPDETLAALQESLGDGARDDGDVLQRLLRRARSAHRPPFVRQRRVIRTPSGFPASAIPSGWSPPRRHSAWRPPGASSGRQLPWSIGADLLVLWTDGLVDARNDAGEPFGETRLLAEVCARAERVARGDREAPCSRRRMHSARIPIDDRTILVMRI